MAGRGGGGGGGGGGRILKNAFHLVNFKIKENQEHIMILSLLYIRIWFSIWAVLSFRLRKTRYIFSSTLPEANIRLKALSTNLSKQTVADVFILVTQSFSTLVLWHIQFIINISKVKASNYGIMETWLAGIVGGDTF